MVISVSVLPRNSCYSLINRRSTFELSIGNGITWRLGEKNITNVIYLFCHIILKYLLSFELAANLLENS